MIGQTRITLYAQAVSTAADLTRAIEARGAEVRLIEGTDASREEARAVLAPALDGADAAMVCVAPLERGVARPLLDWSPSDWRRCSDEAQLQLLQVLQGLHDALDGRACAVVLIGATLGITGAANHTAFATATEGQRGLMKTLARQWGPQVRFSWLSVSTPLLFPDIAESELPEQCELGEYTPSLGRRPGWNDVADAALMLASAGSAGVTGQTLIVDGGEWMLP